MLSIFAQLFFIRKSKITHAFLIKKPYMFLASNKITVSIPFEVSLLKYYYLRVGKPFTIFGCKVVFVSNNLFVIAQLSSTIL